MTLQTRFIIGGIAFVIAVAGLLTAAGSDERSFYIGGLVVAVLGLAVCWLLLKGHFDRWERDPNRPRRAVPRPPSDPDEPADMTPPPAVPPQPVSYRPPPATPNPAARPQRPALDPETRNWIRGAVIGIVGLLGLFVAASGDGFAYWGGLLVFAVAVLLLFRMIGHSFDEAARSDGAAKPEPTRRPSGVPVPSSAPLRWLAGVVAGLIALVALFVAAGGGASYYLGIIASIAAIAYVFYVMKTSFDEMERR